MYKDLRDCKKCEHFVKMEYSDLVVCKRIGDMLSLVVVQPANYQKGFTNYQWIVDCKKTI